LARLLNTTENSPLKGCIVPAAETLGIKTTDEKLRVSMATVVDGILKLISKKPKEDRYKIREPENVEKGRKCLPEIPDLKLRSYYLANNDRALYDILFNYFSAVSIAIWGKANQQSYLRKTVGVQALFDLLLYLLSKFEINSTNFSIESLSERLKACGNIDPDGTKYQASGIGRTAIKHDLISAVDKAFM
jgi:hypothetical protein